MSRVTAPVSKLTRTLLDSSHRNAGAVLMPKYDELLRSRRSAATEQSSETSRNLYTTHRPTPQPSIANRTKPLMQTFHSSASVSRTPSAHLDATIIPALHASAAVPEGLPRMPLLPDNYNTHYAPDSESVASNSHATIVAANPDNVVPGAPLAAVEGVGLDAVELKFAHQQTQQQHQQQSDESTFLSDMLRGMVDDVFGGPKPKTSH